MPGAGLALLRAIPAVEAEASRGVETDARACRYYGEPPGRPPVRSPRIATCWRHTSVDQQAAVAWQRGRSRRPAPHCLVLTVGKAALEADSKANEKIASCGPAEMVNP